MQALITGAGGMIGFALSKRLLERGDKVRALLMPNEPDRGLGKLGAEIVRGDITKPHTLVGICNDCDQVFHLAARVQDWGTRKDFRTSHYDGTLHMLREAAGKIKRFVYLSSAGYYGSGHHLGVDEDTPPNPSKFAYQEMKMLCEKLVKTFHVERGLEYTMIRPTNVISGNSAYVRNVLDSFLRGGIPLIEGGSNSASFVHVENLVDGIVLAADSEIAANREYNFCDDYQVTWREYLTSLSALIGKKPSKEISAKVIYPIAGIIESLFLPFGKRPMISQFSLSIFIQTWHLDTSRARRELGWKTRVSWETAWEEIVSFVKSEYPAKAKKSNGRFQYDHEILASVKL